MGVATILKFLRRSLWMRTGTFSRSFTSCKSKTTNTSNNLTITAVTGGALLIYALLDPKMNKVCAAQRITGDKEKNIRPTAKEKRFIKFASVEYNGHFYMTPKDFLKSLVESEPGTFRGRKILTSDELEKFKGSTPPLSRGSPTTFRSISDEGIISYTEYLFLLSILTKPQSGFRIAFNMVDTDGNEKVDRNEFLVIKKIISQSRKVNRHLNETLGKSVTICQHIDDQHRRCAVDTTLMVHFFGAHDQSTVDFNSFKQFTLDLQTEVLEVEFNDFSGGLTTITEVDFAKILLRHTRLARDEYCKYMDRLTDRLDCTRGITFDEFEVFSQFLYTLEDFNIAMKMYILAGLPISKDEFHRAVKICTGKNLSQHLVNTVFAIFDVDGKGCLSYKEFTKIMKDRLHRRFNSQTNLEAFCIKTC